MIKIDGRAKDLTDMRFGKLVAIAPVGRVPRAIIWKCICDCGGVKKAQSQHLLSGGTRSCGCLVNNSTVPPGTSKHPLYHTWKNMLARCYNPGATGYKRYGKRGITVCTKWKNDFFTFVRDMGPKPDKFSLDRINPDGPYSPTNCRWASAKLQRANQSNSLVREV